MFLFQSSQGVETALIAVDVSKNEEARSGYNPNVRVRILAKSSADKTSRLLFHSFFSGCLPADLQLTCLHVHCLHTIPWTGMIAKRRFVYWAAAFVSFES